MPQPGEERPDRPAVADVPDDVPGLLGPRGGRRAGLLRLHQEFLGDEDGNVRALRLVDVEFEGRQVPAEVEGTEREIPAELVLLAMGFTGPEQEGLVEQLGVELDERGNVARDNDYLSSVDGVFVAGDAGRGQSLIVWAIAEGRAAAAAVDTYLTGSTDAARPIPPTERPLMV